MTTQNNDESSIEKPANSPAKAQHQVDQFGGTETILVVEDDTAVREVAVFVLRELGYSVFEAADGPSALRLLNQIPKIDLLFSVVVMPGGLKGQDVAAWVREKYPSV